MSENKKKAKRPVKKISGKPVRTSNTPPSAWPSDEQWQQVEKNLRKSLSSRILLESAGPVERAKFELCAQFVQYFQEHPITQREMAASLGVTESRISEILHYHYERFTIDKLLELLSRIKPAVRLRVA